MAQLVKNPPVMWDTWIRSLGWEDPLEKRIQHRSVLTSTFQPEMLVCALTTLSRGLGAEAQASEISLQEEDWS